MAPASWPGALPWWCLESTLGPTQPGDEALPQERVPAPCFPCSGSPLFGDTLAAADATLQLPPPPLVTLLMARAGLLWPAPAAFQLLRPPRCRPVSA